ncbi:MAG: radical SAM protein, partial [Thermodesulfovibrionales bacterium]
MKVSVLTIGCRTNQSESQSIIREILTNGHQLVDLKENPDFCVINTCAVTSKADSQSRQTIQKALRYANKVVVTGCFAHLNKSYIKGLDRILLYDNNFKNDIIKIFQEDSRVNSKDIKMNVSRPIIKVQEGCNDNCTYCSIINARGKSKSIHPKEIIDTVKQYVDEGYSEIVLSGTNIGQYGSDLSSKLDIYMLISEILSRTSIKKIRISSIEVKFVNDTLIELLKDERVCKHLHIPLQSGDNHVLRSMNRQYSIEEYYYRVNKVKEVIDNIAI